MFFPAQCSLPSPVPHLESDFYWLIFTEEVLSRVVTIRPLRPSFEIFFVGIFSLKKKNQKPSVQRLLRGSETAKGPRQHQGLPHFLPSQLLTLSSVPFFSPSASLPSGPVSSPRSVPATVPVKMPKPSRVQQALAGRQVVSGPVMSAGVGLAGGECLGQGEEIVGRGSSDPLCSCGNPQGLLGGAAPFFIDGDLSLPP